MIYLINEAINETDYTIDDFFHQGRFAESGKTLDDIDPEQLNMGIKIEMEHTKNKAVSIKIALDHLAEFGNYYTGLAEMEAKLRAEKDMVTSEDNPL